MNVTIISHETGERVRITRDVCAVHPAWIHEQCGTQSEGELQRMLDQYRTEDFYDEYMNHLGPDPLGISLQWDYETRVQ